MFLNNFGNGDELGYSRLMFYNIDDIPDAKEFNVEVGVWYTIVGYNEEYLPMIHVDKDHMFTLQENELQFVDIEDVYPNEEMLDIDDFFEKFPQYTSEEFNFDMNELKKLTKDIIIESDKLESKSIRSKNEKLNKEDEKMNEKTENLISEMEKLFVKNEIDRYLDLYNNNPSDEIIKILENLSYILSQK